MGMFDTVKTIGPDYVCSEGHTFEADPLQSKDFGETMGWVEIGPVGSTVVQTADHWGYAEVPGLTDYVRVYGTCKRCPHLVQPKTGNVCGVWVEFKVHIVKDVVQGIERVSQDTPTFLAEQPKLHYMEGALGPFSYEQAHEVSRAIWAKKQAEKG